MTAKVNAAHLRLPFPPPSELPRILATGLSILKPPLFATLPAVKLKAPWSRLKRAEFEVPFESQTNSFSAIRALFERLNAVPSVKVMPTAPLAPVSIVSCRQTGSPTLTWATTPPASVTVTGPVAVRILPIAGGGGAPVSWAQPPIAPASPGASQVSRNTRPLPVLWGAYSSETRFLRILFQLNNIFRAFCLL